MQPSQNVSMGSGTPGTLRACMVPATYPVARSTSWKQAAPEQWRWGVETAPGTHAACIYVNALAQLMPPRKGQTHQIVKPQCVRQLRRLHSSTAAARLCTFPCSFSRPRMHKCAPAPAPAHLHRHAPPSTCRPCCCAGTSHGQPLCTPPTLPTCITTATVQLSLCRRTSICVVSCWLPSNATPRCRKLQEAGRRRRSGASSGTARLNPSCRWRCTRPAAGGAATRLPARFQACMIAVVAGAVRANGLGV